MTRPSTALVLLIFSLSIPAAASKKDDEAAQLSEKKAAKEKTASTRELTAEQRLAFIRRSQVWMPTNVAEMDLRLGPQGKGAFEPGEKVTCDYFPEKLSGQTPKFDCRLPDGDVVKVKYGAANGEVEGAVLATRLLWALGFGADRVYPVQVTCRGCSVDPWNDRRRTHEEHVFNPAVIERKPAGHEMKTTTNEGWAWPELDLIDEAQGGGAPRAHRDALTLLAVFIQHADNKPEQQRLLCLPDGVAPDGTCDKPFMMTHDVGMTFGHANYLNRNVTGSVNFSEWSRTPMWRDAAACVGHMSKSKTGTLGDPKISEAGRAFLADLLVQLTDQQLHDLFEVAQVERRSRKPGSAEPPATIDAWVAAFKSKREEIVGHHCPA